MGKGYNNYMCKKPFHPGSKANIKRAWMAEQKTENEKKKQDDLKTQYEKEQDLYNNRALISSESKDKLELNFMYEAPPGAKRERQKEDDEPEYKFEWQRKYNAPREDYARGNEDIKDQPFGIPVRNVRCIKCHKWGHINTDRECPLFMQASASSMPTTSMDPMELMRQMREDGYGLKENVLGHHLNPKAANQQLIASEESDPETEFLKSLSTTEKKKLLRKLKKLSKKQEKSKKKKSKKSKKSKSKDSTESESEKETKRKSKKKSSSSSSESSSDESTDMKKKKNGKKNLADSSTSYEPKPKKQHDNYREHKHSKKSKSEKKNTDIDKDKDRSKKTKLEEPSTSKKYSTKGLSRKESSKTYVGVTQSNWKSSYSSSSSDDEETAATCSKEGPSAKRKTEENSPSSKKVKIEKCYSGVIDTPTCGKPEHPDGFCHSCPQAKVAYNYLVAEEEYKGKMHDEFRHHYREDRSPSVKQKYYK